MSTIHYFYPAHDLALAFGGEHFTPPRAAVRLQSAGALLPLWLADPTDRVLYVESVDNRFFDSISQILLPDVSVTSTITSQYTLSPWGWSNAVFTELSRFGASDKQLPSTEILNEIRKTSHRRTSIIINRELSHLGIDIPVEAVEITSAENIPDVLGKYQNVVLKSPWSSSGRGVFMSHNFPASQLRHIAKGIIARQGSIICEPLLDKIRDFAMLFSSNGKGEITYCGLSLFSNRYGSTYSGNIVAGQSALERQLTFLIDGELLDNVKTALLKVLPGIITPYTGNFGIDMMIYRTADGQSHIAPCIELNLRNTMGFIALSLAEKYLAPDSYGVFEIPTTDSNANSMPPVIHNSKLVKGTLNLVPENPYFKFTLSVLSQ